MALYIFFWLALVCVFIYFVYQRIQNIKTEQFEKRDN